MLVLGGYGAFGRCVAERLAAASDIEVVVAGRSLDRASHTARDIAVRNGCQVTGSRLDATDVSLDQLRSIAASVVINASGSYQQQDYSLARACIAAGAHYLDLADARGFVTGIRTLDADARRAGVLVVSGASSVPAVSGAVADAFAPEFASLRSISTIIAPGNHFNPGLATTRSILSGLGRPIVSSSATPVVRGWQGLRRERLPGLGARWIGHCDAPDRDLFPQRYAGLERTDVYAALEIGALHLGLWALSGLTRARLVPKPDVLARPLLAMKRGLSFLGSDRGGMLVSLRGLGRDGSAAQMDWHLLAEHGHGPYVPATPAVLLAKRLLDGSLQDRGATPCVGLFSLADFMAEVADLDITAGST